MIPFTPLLFAMDNKDFSKMKAQFSMFVDDVSSKQVCVSIICMTLHYAQLCQTQLITLRVHHRFDDEVKDDAHGAFTPEMMKLPQATWIETFLEGVTDKSSFCPTKASVLSVTFVEVVTDKSRTTHIQGACLVCVQGLWCHVLSICM